MLRGFRTFVLRGNVVDLAVGLVIGAAFGAVVQALVKDFITPLVAIPLGKAGDFASRYWTVGGAQFKYGDFLNAVVTFLLTAAAVYFFVVTPVNRLMARFHPAQDAPKRICPECLQTVPDQARRCMFCTSELTAA